MMAQPFEQSEKSLWGQEMLEKVQRKERGEVMDEDDEEDFFGAIPDEVLAGMELD